MAFLKLARWLLTALLVLAFLVSLGAGPIEAIQTGFAVVFLLLGLWLAPRVFARERATQTARLAGRNASFRQGFNADIRHDNIALDTMSDVLWIRDASGAERYLERGEVLSWKSAHDWNNGTFRQRLEIDVKDVLRPRWHVLFQRHSDTWIKTSKRNGQERDEWFARLGAWDKQGPSASAQTKAAGIDMSLPGLHRHYYAAANDLQRQNYLVAFDISCLSEELDQKSEWERLGGAYPGPSPDLLKFGKGRTSEI